MRRYQDVPALYISLVIVNANIAGYWEYNTVKTDLSCAVIGAPKALRVVQAFRKMLDPDYILSDSTKS